MTPSQQLSACLGRDGEGPLFVHSDLLLASCFVELSTDRQELLKRHVSVLEEVAGRRPIWMPVFNYDFLKTGQFNLNASPCALGPLAEYFRLSRADWRTVDPVFSVAGTGRPPHLPPESSRIDPFGDPSVFAELLRRHGTVFFYGAQFSSATIIHYFERKFIGPSYRYDKIFKGVIIEGEKNWEVEYVYHVRPLHRVLDYDWERLARDLSARGLSRSILWKNRCVAFAVNATDLDAFWHERLKHDPLYFLDEESRAWVEPMLGKLGRAFELADFERGIE